jgi:hypothetical protein
MGTIGIGKLLTTTAFINDEEFGFGGYRTRNEILRFCIRNPIGSRGRDEQCSSRTSAECPAKANGDSLYSQSTNSLHI